MWDHYIVLPEEQIYKYFNLYIKVQLLDSFCLYWTYRMNEKSRTFSYKLKFV